MAKQPSSWVQDLGRIVLLWGLAMGIAILWILLDQDVPAWDQAEHLSHSMNHWWTLTQSDWLSPEGWRHLWMLSPKYPPVFYWVTALVHSLLGPGSDQAMTANAFFALVLLIATYGLGRHLFSAQVGMLAAGVCLLMPRLIHTGLDYQLDYAVTAVVMVCLWSLTVWRDATQGFKQWVWIGVFGVSFGLALMTKQAALLFLGVPLLWVGLAGILYRRWGRLLQLLLGAISTLIVMLPWLSVNWVFQFSILENTNVRSAQAEGDPMLNTFAAWLYYWQDLPSAVSWVLLLVPLIGIILWLLGLLPGRRSPTSLNVTQSGYGWLLIYLLAAYLLWSAIVNKDPRYIAPYLPALAIFLAWGLACWSRLWPGVVWGTLGVGVLVTLLNLFPLGFAPAHWLASTLAPNAQLYPHPAFSPHVELITHVAQASPYQISTIGGLHSTAIVNQHNVSYYGKLQDYQVYGRQVGSRPSLIEKDLRSLSWFYAQGDINQPWPLEEDNSHAEMVRQLEQRPDFSLEQTWDLPDNKRLYLYRRQQFPVTVMVLPESACASDPLPRLNRVEAPAQISPGQAMPVTYEWLGTWKDLQAANVLLTWQPATNADNANARAWIHDHGIGLGTLRPNPIQANQTTLSAADINSDGCFQVTEYTATFPPESTVPGAYRLTGRYFSSADNAPSPLEVPEVMVTVNPQAAPAIPAENDLTTPMPPEIDWVTQLRETARFLPQGPGFLDEVFDPIGRINVYDPIQNYTVQAEKTLQLRWQDSPDSVEYGYGLALAQVLQLKVDAAISTLNQLAIQDAENPYVHAYLGFVNLYAFRPKSAQTALQPALELAPESAEIQGLSAISALFQGNLWGAWQKGRLAIALATPEN
ncbi:MAG: phospholipid carrier-dependent glycosyltransferase [Leptolyngbya sp. SIO1D8]|nr:phospholipid carrier-dependent glycosyltransferase [Leptolyngbya sp. SIO1D8]